MEWFLCQVPVTTVRRCPRLVLPVARRTVSSVENCVWQACDHWLPNVLLLILRILNLLGFSEVLLESWLGFHLDFFVFSIIYDQLLIFFQESVLIFLQRWWLRLTQFPRNCRECTTRGRHVDRGLTDDSRLWHIRECTVKISMSSYNCPYIYFVSLVK